MLRGARLGMGNRPGHVPAPDANSNAYADTDTHANRNYYAHAPAKTEPASHIHA